MCQRVLLCHRNEVILDLLDVIEADPAVTLAGKAVKVDTAGLEATVFAKKSDVFIKANESVPDAQAFVLAAGSSVSLGGTFFLKAEEADVRLLFCKLL